MSLSYRNQSIDLLYKLMDWFLYGRDLRHKRVKVNELTIICWQQYIRKLFSIDYVNIYFSQSIVLANISLSSIFCSIDF